MSEKPAMTFDGTGVPSPCSWEQYAELISGGMQMNQKYNVMALLKAQMDWINDSTACPGIWGVLQQDKFSDDALYDLKTIISVQILSLAWELSENLAATCFAYAEAVDHGAKFFPLLLRDFGLPIRDLKAQDYDAHGIDVIKANARAFYASVSAPASLQRFMGSPALAPAEVVDLRAKFEQLAQYRGDFDRWYMKYKHAHGTVPVHTEGKVADGRDFKWFMTHRVPDYLTTGDARVAIRDRVPSPVVAPQANVNLVQTESFLSPLELLPRFGMVGQTSVALWQQVRHRQHKNLFGREAP